MSVAKDARTLEWLEADGLGGFAMGTAAGIRTRRYHGLLLAATRPPTGRFMLVNGLEAWADTAVGSVALSSQAYGPGLVHPDGLTRIERFATEPFPTWTFALPDGTRIAQEIFAVKGRPLVAVVFRVVSGAAPRLRVRLLMSGRDPHGNHHENDAFAMAPESRGQMHVWRPYDGVPEIVVLSNGMYEHQPDWWRSFFYAEEAARGLDAREDLASPGTFHFDLARGDAVLLLAAGSDSVARGAHRQRLDPLAVARKLRAGEVARRGRFEDRLARAADAYVVQRGAGQTIIAGYPWFTDWGRDTFIALRGLCLARRTREGLATAGRILHAWAGAVSKGMLPNFFPEHDRPEQGQEPEFNSVDAALWFVVAVHDWLAALPPAAARKEEKALGAAVTAILDAYARGTRHGIRMDADGLLRCGAPGVQLTWTDAKVGDHVVTPRIGKPVEVQALWINAMRIGARFDAAWQRKADAAQKAFAKRFWNEARGCLFDVVDADHQAGKVDAALRPNQILAVGGLPFPLLDGARARAVVATVERELWTPMGLRSLARDEPEYRPRYEGGVWERDTAYHQGTAWPWLIGPFVAAWLRVRGASAAARKEASTRFLAPLLAHLDDAGLGHVSEIADGDAPHTPRGCPFQAWSLGEVIRVERMVLKAGADGAVAEPPVRAAKATPGRARVDQAGKATKGARAAHRTTRKITASRARKLATPPARKRSPPPRRTRLTAAARGSKPKAGRKR